MSDEERNTALQTVLGFFLGAVCSLALTLFGAWAVIIGLGAAWAAFCALVYATRPQKETTR